MKALSEEENEEENTPQGVHEPDPLERTSQQVLVSDDYPSSMLLATSPKNYEYNLQRSKLLASARKSLQIPKTV